MTETISYERLTMQLANSSRAPRFCWRAALLGACFAATVLRGSAIVAAEPLVREGNWEAIRSRFDDYDVVATPDRDEAEWWVGAPSVVRDDEGTFWMAARMRTADRPLGKRGYEIRIFRSSDGKDFARVHSILREEVPLPGFERPALLLDPQGAIFKLYACGRLNGPWCIFRFDDADRPDEFIANTARAVIEPQAGPRIDPAKTVGTYERPAPVPDGFKDPVIFWDGARYHAYVIGTIRSTERTYHFTSEDGDRWTAVGNPSRSMLELVGWHDFAVRPASVLPLGVGYLYVYEGSSSTWSDPVYNIATGLGFTFDLSQVQDLTMREPLLVSSTPGRLHTWRYSHWMWVEDEVWVFAEVEKANGAHEIRRYRLGRL